MRRSLATLRQGSADTNRTLAAPTRSGVGARIRAVFVVRAGDLRLRAVLRAVRLVGEHAALRVPLAGIPGALRRETRAGTDVARRAAVGDTARARAALPHVAGHPANVAAAGAAGAARGAAKLGAGNA